MVAPWFASWKRRYEKGHVEGVRCFFLRLLGKAGAVLSSVFAGSGSTPFDVRQKRGGTADAIFTVQRTS